MATIRNFQPGDEAAQVAVYNQAAAQLPYYRPDTVLDVQRRSRVRGVEPGPRLFVEDGGQVVGFIICQTNGRVGFPWCLPGQEKHAVPLLQQALAELRKRRVPRAFAAFRSDWKNILDFYLQNGFHQAREMVNFIVDLVDMPTPPSLPSSSILPVTSAEVPAIFRLMPEALRVSTPEELEKHLFRNPFFTAESLFLLRSRTSDEPVALGLLVTDLTYANPKRVDPFQPNYRLGAFGSEGMLTERINGLFSFIASKEHNVHALGLDLLGHACYRLRTMDDVDALAAQVPSDVPSLLQFYQRGFQKQGSFPVLECPLG